MDVSARKRFSVDSVNSTSYLDSVHITNQIHNSSPMKTRVITILILSLLCFAMNWATERTLHAQRPEIIVERGHTLYVTASAFSGDGRLLATGSLNEIKLWDVSSGMELRTYKCTSTITSLVFPDDTTLVAAGVAAFGGRTECVRFDIMAGRSSVQSFSGLATTSASVSADGHLVIFGTDDGTIVLTESRTGAVLQQIQNTLNVVTAAAIASDSVVYIGDEEGTLTEFLLPSLTSRSSWTAHGAAITAICTGDSLVATVGKDSTARLWTRSLEPRGVLADSSALVSVALSKSHDRLAIGNREGTVSVYHCATRRLVRRIHPVASIVSSLAFSPDGAMLISGGLASVRSHSMPDGESLSLFGGASGSVVSVGFSPNGLRLVSSDYRGKVAIWNLGSGVLERVLVKPNAFIRPVQFSPDGKLLLIGDQFEPSVQVSYFGLDKEIITLRGHGADISDARFSPDGQVITTASLDSTIMVWDAVTFDLLHTLSGHESDVTTTSFSPYGSILATGGSDHTVRLWDVYGGRPLASLRGHLGPVLSVHFGAESEWLVSTSADSTIIFWDVKTRSIRRVIPQPAPVATSAINASRDVLATAAQNQIKLWDCQTGLELRRLTGDPEDDFSSIAFSDDGKYLAAGSYNSNVKLWNLERGELIAMLVVLDESNWVVLASDGAFDGTSEGLKRVHYVQGITPLPLDAFFEEWYTPSLFADLLSGKRRPAARVADLRKEISLPPKVRFTSPRGRQTVDTETASITIEATDQGGGIDEVRLYHNGKFIGSENVIDRQTSMVGKRITLTYSIPLLAGENTLRATAFNRDRTESQPQEIKIKRTAAEATSTLFLLIVGINDYKNGTYSLNYARPDAQAFSSRLRQAAGGIFKKIVPVEIFDSSVTRTALQSAFEQVVRDAKPQDAFVFYYAGHGVMSEGDSSKAGEFYLVPHDVTRLYGDNEGLAAGAFSAGKMKDYCTRIKATKQLVVMDACQSGGAVEAFSRRGASEEKAILQLARSAGLVVMSATGTEQFATEFGQLGHGVFTYALLKGLSGEADAGSDGKITVKELEAYVNDHVPELTKRYRGTAQYPNSYARGQDFPIGVVK